MNISIADIYQLSPLQEGLLFHDLCTPNTGMYVDQNTLTLKGDFQIPAFQQAWQQVMDRHPILRTSFQWQKLKTLVQVVHRELGLPWTELDWQDGSPQEQQAKLAEWLRCDRIQGFQLNQAPLFRLTLIKLASDTTLIAFTKHHIILDGWSRMVIFKEVFAAYQAISQGTTLQFPPFPPFRNYIRWLKAQNIDAAQAYWTTQLKGLEQPTALPKSQHRPPPPTSNPYHNCIQSLSIAETEALNRFVRQHKITQNTVVFAAWSLILSHFSGQTDILFGVISSGRSSNLASVESIVGLLINTLPLRVRIDPNQYILEWLKQFQKYQVEMRQFEYCPLTQIQAWSDIPTGTPLFEIVGVFENYPVDQSLRTQNAVLEVLDAQTLSQFHYPLTFYGSEGPQLKLEISYRQDYFSEQDIQKLLRSTASIINQIVDQPQHPIQSLDLPARNNAINTAQAAFEANSSPLKTSDPSESKPRAIRTVEASLKDIWTSLLNIEDFDPETSFFELGGHSLLTLHLWNRIHSKFDLELPLADLLENPDFQSQITLIETKSLKQSNT